jgi:hypothetical protein
MNNLKKLKFKKSEIQQAQSASGSGLLLLLLTTVRPDRRSASGRHPSGPGHPSRTPSRSRTGSSHHRARGDAGWPPPRVRRCCGGARAWGSTLSTRAAEGDAHMRPAPLLLPRHHMYACPPVPLPPRRPPPRPGPLHGSTTTPPPIDDAAPPPIHEHAGEGGGGASLTTRVKNRIRWVISLRVGDWGPRIEERDAKQTAS